MTPEEQEHAFAEVDEGMSRMMEKAQTSSTLILEAIKLRMAHQEKLVILNAGTLALSFSAITAYHAQHSQSSVSTGSLQHAWQLLMCAIVLSLNANWLCVYSTTHYANSQYMTQVSASFDRYEGSFKDLLPDYAKRQRARLDIETERGEIAGRYSNIFTTSSHVFGLLAQLVTCLAFVFLYYFAKSVLATL
jgi:hypothetical protein